MYNRDTSNNRRKDTKTNQLEKQNSQTNDKRRRNSEEVHNFIPHANEVVALLNNKKSC